MNLLSLSTIREIFGFPYYLLAPSFAMFFWILFSIFDQRIFFTPYFVFYVPKEGTIDLVLSTIISIMLGVVISMNIYCLVNNLGTKKQSNGGLSLSVLPGTISILSSTCVGCSVFMSTLMISMFGALGITALSLLTSYNTDIRLISLVLLLYSCYVLYKNIRNSRICRNNLILQNPAYLK